MSKDDATISPVFRYRDAPAAIAWLERAYGFTTHEQHAAPDGAITHAELRLDGSGIGVSSAGPAVDGHPWSAVRCGLYICRPDVDATYERAVAAGAEIPQPINDTSYGAREFSVRDPGGHLWSVGTYGMSTGTTPSSVFAALHYPDGHAALDWLTTALGFAAAMEVPGPGDTIQHAELSLGRAVLMMGSTPRDAALWGDLAQMTCCVVADPDAHHARAVAAGAAIVLPPQNTPYGSRDYYTRDCEGFVWGFGTYRPEAAR